MHCIDATRWWLTANLDQSDYDTLDVGQGIQSVRGSRFGQEIASDKTLKLTGHRKFECPTMSGFMDDNVDQPWQAADRWMTFPEKVVVRGLGIKLNQRDSESLCAASCRPQLYTGVGQNSVQTISSKAHKIIQHFLSTSPLPQAPKKLPGFRQFIGLCFLSNENVDSWVIWRYSPAYSFGGFSK